MKIKAIGDNVKFYREQKGFTQTELGNKTFITQQGVNRIEHHESVPRIETLEAFAKALDVSLSDLCYDANETNDFGLDFTQHYIMRMESETKDVKAIMNRALEECNGKMIVVLRLSRSEQDMYKIWNGDKKDAVRFWEFIDEYGFKNALNTPADYDWCLKKLEEFEGDKEQVTKAWIDKLIKRYGLRCTVGFPHNVNAPWLCSKDSLQFLSLIGFTSFSDPS